MLSESWARTNWGLAFGPPIGCLFVIAEAVHNRRKFGKYNASRRSLECSIVLLGHVDVGGEKLSKVACPIRSQEPWCPKRYGFADPFCFPKFQSPVDGVDGIGSLKFSKVVGKSSNEVASLLTHFIGAESFFHVEPFDGVATQVLNDFPKLNSATKYWTVKSSSNLRRG